MRLTTRLDRDAKPEDQISRWLGGRSFAQCREDFDRDGYIVFEQVLSSAEVDSIRTALEPHLEGDVRGRNEFEGRQSIRVYALLAKSPVFADLVIHPLPLAFAEAELGPSCLLSACLAINLQPGETAQPWHYDEAHIHLPRPRSASHLSTFWAIDAMTDENGATEVLPGSHAWPEDELPGSSRPEDFATDHRRQEEGDRGHRPDALKITVPAGSLMIAKGTLWHRGGANRSSRSRLIVTPQYCAGWARQLENQILAVPRATARGLPERARELIGYSIHPPFMGYANGVHPKRRLR